MSDADNDAPLSADEVLLRQMHRLTDVALVGYDHSGKLVVAGSVPISDGHALLSMGTHHLVTMMHAECAFDDGQEDEEDDEEEGRPVREEIEALN